MHRRITLTYEKNPAYHCTFDFEKQEMFMWSTEGRSPGERISGDFRTKIEEMLEHGWKFSSIEDERTYRKMIGKPIDDLPQFLVKCTSCDFESDIRKFHVVFSLPSCCFDVTKVDVLCPNCGVRQNLPVTTEDS